MKKDSTMYGAVRPSWDKDDCSIRALACATGVPYLVASATFSAFGRQVKKGTEAAISIRLHEEVLGMKRITLAEGIRLEAFLEVAKTGSYIVHKKGHSFAVIDGIVHDWDNTSRASTQLIRVWKVTDVARGKMQAMARITEGLG